MAVGLDGVLIMEGKTYLSTREVARRLSVWTSTIRKACRRGELEALRIGRDWWIEESALERYRPVYGRGRWGPRGGNDDPR